MLFILRTCTSESSDRCSQSRSLPTRCKHHILSFSEPSSSVFEEGGSSVFSIIPAPLINAKLSCFFYCVLSATYRHEAAKSFSQEHNASTLRACVRHVTPNEVSDWLRGLGIKNNSLSCKGFWRWQLVRIRQGADGGSDSRILHWAAFNSKDVFCLNRTNCTLKVGCLKS